MIVDTLTHVWQSPEQLGHRAQAMRRRDLSADPVLHADPVEHFESLGPVDVALVLAFDSQLLDARVPNRLVADYVQAHPDRLIGVAAVDPTRPTALADLDEAVGGMGHKAVALSPSAQGFHPMDSRALGLYRRLRDRNLPVIFHAGPCPSPDGRLDYANPVLLDEVLREFDGLRMVVGGLGAPWAEQTFALMAKHPMLLANLGGLLASPWRAYHSLMLAQEYGVMDRLLFSSGFPFAKPVACIETLYSLNRMVQGAGLPTVPREQLRGIVERDTLTLLGLPAPAQPAAAQTPTPHVSTAPASSPKADNRPDATP